MTRQAVRDMKRVIASQGKLLNGAGTPIAREAATSLLERSILFGHGRLAVIRLAIAADVGAEIPTQCWTYCEAAARESADFKLQALFLRACQRSDLSEHKEKSSDSA